MDTSRSRVRADELDLPAEEARERRRTRRDAEFERLYAEFADRVTRLVRRFIVDPDQAADIVQETFLRAYGVGLHTEYREADPECSQWPWLAAVARNLALDALRKRRGIPTAEVTDDLADNTGWTLDDPDVALLSVRQRDGITRALDTLEPRQRRMLVLQHVNGWSYRDLVEVEGISLDAVKSALARARRRFKDTYTQIADHGGLVVVTGGLLTRAFEDVRARARSTRDRLATMPDVIASAGASSPGLVNTFATLGVLAAVGAVGALSATATAHADTEPERVAVVSPAPVDLEVTLQPGELAFDPAPEPTVEAFAGPTGEEPVVVAAEPPPEAPPPAPETTGGGGTGASVDSSELVPIEGSPASGSGSISQSEDGIRDEHTVEVDLDGDGEPDVGTQGDGGLECPPPDERTLVGSAVCPVITGEDPPEAVL